METDPTQKVSRDLLGHIHLIADFRYPTIQQTGIDYILEELLKAPRIIQDRPVSWNFLETPPDGTVFLAYQPANRGSFPSDGYVWAQPEQLYRQEINGSRPELNGFILEMCISPYGYNPRVESQQGPAMHCRRRYRLLPNQNNDSKSGNPILWIVHYHRAGEFFAANRIAVGPQDQQIFHFRQSLLRFGNLQEKKFMLQDQANWPTVIVPGQQLGHPVRGHIITFAGPQAHQNARAMMMAQQQGYAGENGPSPKRPRHSNASVQRAAGMRSGAAVPPSAIEEDKDDPEETDRRDLYDILTQRDISQYRFEQHADWMEEVFSDYSTFDIEPVSLGLGRAAFMNPITDGFFDMPRPPTPPPRPREPGEERAPRRVPTAEEREAENQKYDSDIMKPLKPGQAEEFFQHVKKKLAENQREIEEMERKHEEDMARMLRGRKYLDAAEDLRDLVSTDEGVSSEAAKIDGGRTAIHNPANGDATIAALRQMEQIGKISESIEEMTGKKVKAMRPIEMIEKGGLVEEAPNTKSKNTSVSNGDQVLFDDFLEPGASSGQQSNKPSASPQPFTNNAQSTAAPQNNGTEDWVMVDKQDTQPTTSAAPSNEAANPASGPNTSQPEMSQPEVSSDAPNDDEANDNALETDLADFGAEEEGAEDFDGGAFDDAIDFGDLDTAGEAMEDFAEEGDVDVGLPDDGTDIKASEDDAMDVLEDSAFGDAFHHTAEAMDHEQGEGQTPF